VNEKINSGKVLEFVGLIHTDKVKLTRANGFPGN
jgi:hypothetical protein